MPQEKENSGSWYDNLPKFLETVKAKMISVTLPALFKIWELMQEEMTRLLLTGKIDSIKIKGLGEIKPVKVQETISSTAYKEGSHKPSELFYIYPEHWELDFVAESDKVIRKLNETKGTTALSLSSSPRCKNEPYKESISKKRYLELLIQGVPCTSRRRPYIEYEEREQRMKEIMDGWKKLAKDNTTFMEWYHWCRPPIAELIEKYGRNWRNAKYYPDSEEEMKQQIKEAKQKIYKEKREKYGKH